MKTKIVIFIMLFMLGMVFACSKSDENDSMIDSSIREIIQSDEVSDFFDREWMYLGIGSPQSFFQKNNQEVCAWVNSEEDLRELYQGNGTIPYIDFQQYTLVIGRKRYYTKEGEKSPTEFECQKLYITDGKYVMDLFCKYSVPEFSLFSDNFICFWGIYPKLRPKDIIVNIQYVD